MDNCFFFICFIYGFNLSRPVLKQYSHPHIHIKVSVCCICKISIPNVYPMYVGDNIYSNYVIFQHCSLISKKIHLFTRDKACSITYSGGSLWRNRKLLVWHLKNLSFKNYRWISISKLHTPSNTPVHNKKVLTQVLRFTWYFFMHLGYIICNRIVFSWSIVNTVSICLLQDDRDAVCLPVLCLWFLWQLQARQSMGHRAK